jgi:ATP-dependent Clp protease protease subunit
MKRNNSKSKDKDHFGGCTIHQEGLYVNILNQNRHILLFSDIDDEMAFIVVAKIRAMNEMNKKQPILIEINSRGGTVAGGISIINAMLSSKAPIITLINGEACSMAAYISICGNERFMYGNSFWMLHPVQDLVGDYISFIKDRAAYLDKLEKTMDTIIQAATKLSEEDVKKAKTGELWFNAEQCLARNVVDKIAG